MPFKSEEAEAAVGEVLATVFVLVSDMWILDTGIPKLRAATCTGQLNWGVKIAKMTTQGNIKAISNEETSRFLQE